MRRLALVPFLAAALLVGLLPLSAPPARAACPDPGGAGMPSHSNVTPDEVQVLGRGWGHGVGMSQYGARGAAILGCSAREILGTYYPGTQLSLLDTNAPIDVSLWPDRPNGPGIDFLDVYAETELVWQVRTTDGAVAELPRRQPRGTVWRARVDGDGKHVVLDLSRDEGQQERKVHEGAGTDTYLLPLNGDRIAQLPQKSSNEHWRDGRPYRRGSLAIQPFGGLDPRLRVQVRLPTVEQYLYGLSEMPSSWEPAALQAQAIAGRSYAMRNRGRPLWDSASDQVYSGLLKESEPTFGARWVRAVDDSRGQVVTHQGEIAQTYYSSSHGGQSENNAFSAFFSGANPLPYLTPVDDTRWELAAGSPVATWSHSYTAADVGRTFGVGEVREVNLKPLRGAGGRVGVPGRTVYSDRSKTYGGVEIVGTTGTKTISGLEFVQRLNVTRRSELFEVRVNIDRCRPLGDLSDATSVTRSFGPGRIETAVATSARHWETSEHAVIATAGGRDEGFADALSAAALAARLDAPLLLTGSRELAAAVRDELARLQVDTVHLMGGSAALSTEVEARLESAGYEVRRVAGDTRFATARAAALEAGPSPSGDVALALGLDWPDAVSAGALAASGDRVPTLLSLRDSVPEVTMQALAELEPDRVLLIGGTGALGDEVTAQLVAAGHTVARLGGRTRWETSLAVARDALRRDGDGPRPAVLASGAAFPDALAAGAVTARLAGTLVLVPRCELGPVPQIPALLSEGHFDRGLIVGGTAAVSDRVREQAADAIDGD